ncbi:MAG: ABC transporter ATP-binding protein [Anaerolineae bacterium]|nr:ABC transporter ATP-binding protein [Anaerolineae bacterium]
MLKNINFELTAGNAVGFIGKNGAGKSTALKLITRIIEPTSGSVYTNGRVGALLELGAGFHPDLTGRENIYLNGAVLGLDRAYLHNKFDEIVAFSELESFIDVPVKYYSSGMYVRLGFSVAVHTEPEILLIDEVLAVGDANFQHKCLERITDLRLSGVTIVFVSHSLDAIQNLCDEAFWFEDGQIAFQGSATDTIMEYLNFVAEMEERAANRGRTDDNLNVDNYRSNRRWGSGRVRITKVELCDKYGNPATTYLTGDMLSIKMTYRSRERVEDPVFGIAIHHQNGTHVCGPNTHLGGVHIPYVDGAGIVRYEIPDLPLLQGAYLISVSAHEKNDVEMYDYQDRLYPFRVYPKPIQEGYGMVALKGTWKLE